MQGTVEYDTDVETSKGILAGSPRSAHIQHGTFLDWAEQLRSAPLRPTRLVGLAPPVAEVALYDNGVLVLKQGQAVHMGCAQ